MAEYGIRDWKVPRWGRQGLVAPLRVALMALSEEGTHPRSTEQAW